MHTIHLDGKRLETEEGSTLASILSGHEPGCCVAIIRPALKEQAKTSSLAITTTAGVVTIEVQGQAAAFWNLLVSQSSSNFTGRTGTQPHSDPFLPASDRTVNPIFTIGGL